MASIAFEHGLPVDKIWQTPENAEVRNRRADHHLLMPGDLLVVPALESKSETGSTLQKHRFRRRGVPARFQLQMTLKRRRQNSFLMLGKISNAF